MNPLISIDIETTGLDSREDQILEIGAVIDFDGKMPVENVPAFRCFVKHDRIMGDAYALQLNNGILRQLAGVDELTTVVLEPQEAVEGLYRFMRLNMPEGVKKFTPAGKNFAGFDRQFLTNLHPLFKSHVLPLLGHRTFDPGNLFWIPEIDGYDLPSLETCLERAGMQPTGLHTAVGDAIDVMKLVRYKLTHTARKRLEPSLN